MNRAPLLLALLLGFAGCTANNATDPLSQDQIVLWNTSEIVVQPTGGERWALDTGSDMISQVTPAADGQLAWTAIQRGGASVVTHVVADALGTAPNTVEVPTSPFFYAWSADSRSLGFLGNDQRRGGVMFGVIDITSGTSMRLETGAPFFVDWGPAGEGLFAHVGPDWLGFLDPVDGATSQLGRMSGLFPTPAWTDAGIVIVVEAAPSAEALFHPVGFQSTGSALALVEPGSGTVSEITPVNGGVRFFPDVAGSKLALIDGEGGDQRLRLLSLPDGSEIDVIESGYFEVVQWSPNGNSLLYTERSQLDLPSTPHVWQDSQITTFDESQLSPTFARNYVPFWDQYDRSLSLWSASSDAFALPSSDDDGDFVRIERLDGTSERHDGFSMGVWTR